MLLIDIYFLDIYSFDLWVFSHSTDSPLAIVHSAFLPLAIAHSVVSPLAIKLCVYIGRGAVSLYRSLSARYRG